MEEPSGGGAAAAAGGACWWHIFDGMLNGGQAELSGTGPRCPGYVPTVAVYRLVREERQ